MEITNIKPTTGFGTPTEIPSGQIGPIKGPANPQEQEAVRQEQEKIKQDEAQDPQKATENLADAVEKLNKTAMIFDRSLRFKVHDKTRETMVSVVDMKTDKVIREIPPKEVLDFLSKMKDYIGIIFDKKA